LPKKFSYRDSTPYYLSHKHLEMISQWTLYWVYPKHVRD
jgi:hypothetical protein